MKLKNKKIGIIGELHFEPDKEYHFTVVTGDPADVRIYKKLAALYADWEDAPEEPKEYWYIDCYGEVLRTLYNGNEWDERRKLIGNYFKTKEEAEQAVEKLKAITRLKDKKFRFDGYDVAHKSNGNLAGQIFYDAGNYSIEDVEKEMDLLFGGEE